MKRVISAAIMLPTVLLVFILGNKYVVDVFMGIIALRCIHELFHAFEVKGHHPVRWVGYISAIAIMFIHVIPKEYAIIAIATILPLSILALFIVVLSKKTKTDVIDIAITFFGICYIVLFLMFMSIIRNMENGKFLIWYVFISSWLTDVFAYITGKAIGKHHFTDISPNKTIEGCIGDLSASSIKRYAGIKDFSDLIPGHGGMVDRVDSVIFIAPFAYLLFLFI